VENNLVEETSRVERAAIDPLAAMTALAPLLGTWRGTGRGHYPTIDSFEYVEELVFATNHCQPLFHYVQKTWKRGPNGEAAEPLHSESGFLRCTPAGEFEISNAQDGGRVEVLRGAMAPNADANATLVLHFDSIVLAHDPRLLQTRRTFHLAAGVLRTTVEMATVRNPQLTAHLEAVLTQSW
jgi:hypothetical protein